MLALIICKRYNYSDEEVCNCISKAENDLKDRGFSVHSFKLNEAMKKLSCGIGHGGFRRFLAYANEILKVDVVYFCNLWQEDRVCVNLHTLCEQFDIEIIHEDDVKDEEYIGVLKVSAHRIVHGGCEGYQVTFPDCSSRFIDKKLFWKYFAKTDEVNFDCVIDWATKGFNK